MANSFIVNIPVSPYILKFASVRYGQPVRLDNSTILGTVVIALLGKSSFITRVPLQDRNIQYRHYTESLQCVGPRSLIYHLGYTVSIDQAIQVNRLLEADFKERFHIYVAQHIKDVEWRCGYMKAIEQFADHYNIEIDTDISFEGLKKMHYRYRKSQEEKRKKNLTGLSPTNQAVPLILL